MKQVLQNLRDGKTIVAEVPVPTPQPGEALVCTAVSLVSAGTERTLVEFAEKSLVGKARSRPDLVRQLLDKARREGILTTLDAAFNRLDQPMPLGYSSAGAIVALGEGLQGFRVGQRVACAGGNYAVHAEYATVPKNLLALLPDSVDFESAAFTTLGAIAMHGFRLSETQLGERVAVIGLGLLGLLTVGIALAAGCHVLGVDLEAGRVELAKGMGAEAVIRPQAEEAAQTFSRGKGCDAILICADTPTADPVELAGSIARDKARVVAIGAVGLHIPRKVYYEKEITFLNSRSYGPGRYDPGYEEQGHDYPIGFIRWTEGRNLEAFVDLLAACKLDVKPLITHRFPVGQAPLAYELITGKQKKPFLGVLLTYPEGGQAAVGSGLQESGGKSASDETVSHITSAKSTLGTVTLGVLGAGNFATAVMLPSLRKIPGLNLVGIASASGLSAQHAANRYGARYATSDENRILNDPDINTVAILTRHYLHARQVISALKSGKHVFCEKPLAIHASELGEITEIIKGIGNNQANLPVTSISCPLLMVGFNRRFAPLAQPLMQFLDGRKEPLVAQYRLNAGFLPLTHWAQDPSQGGGRIIGEGCHFVDFLTFLVGEPPVSVMAHSLPDRGRYKEDNVVLTFSFPDGSIGILTYLANGDKSFSKERVEVFSGGRVAVLEDFRFLEMVRDGRRKMFHSRLRQDKGHRTEWEAFVKAILTGGMPPIPYKHLFGVTRATFAAVEALRSGCKVVIPTHDDIPS